jgi:hypothetical protein
MRDELEEIWSSLQKPSSQVGITGKRAPGLPLERAVYLALDHKSVRHLLVCVPEHTELLDQHETRGLQITTEQFQVGENPEALYIALKCTDSAQHRTFNAVTQDIILTLSKSSGSQREAVVGALNRWRAFWASKTHGLTKEEALGLFGELWFLRRWLGKTDLSVLARWGVTANARHDFQWPEASVEVKTTATRAVEGPVHRITSVEQLEDPISGQLYLFSLQVCDDTLAENNLVDLVNSIADELQGDHDALRIFNEKLAEQGYDPSDESEYQRRLLVKAERLFIVREGFPRITSRSFREGTPSGIGNISYSLAISACDQWLIAKSPEDPSVNFLRKFY